MTTKTTTRQPKAEKKLTRKERKALNKRRFQQQLREAKELRRTLRKSRRAMLRLAREIMALPCRAATDADFAAYGIDRAIYDGLNGIIAEHLSRPEGTDEAANDDHASEGSESVFAVGVEDEPESDMPEQPKAACGCPLGTPHFGNEPCPAQPKAAEKRPGRRSPKGKRLPRVKLSCGCWSTQPCPHVFGALFPKPSASAAAVAS